MYFIVAFLNFFGGGSITHYDQKFQILFKSYEAFYPNSIVKSQTWTCATIRKTKKGIHISL